MNFLEAVKEMKEGKKVRRRIWLNPESILYISRGTIYNESTGSNEFISIRDYEATDWEVVDVDEDEDWTLSSKWFRTTFHKEDVKKCRDLILKDFGFKKTVVEVNSKCDLMMSDVWKIINKRFGDLE